MKRLEADIAVVGGSLGGLAAALAALDAGANVVLTEETDWLGGQISSQGVSALDEHAYIETFGATRRYAALREGVRAHYREHYGVRAMPDGKALNPGDGWVSRLCFEPAVGEAVLRGMLQPFVASGQLRVLYNCVPVGADVSDGLIQSVRLEGRGEPLEVTAAYFLDATDLGDLLPMVGAAYVTGAEAHGDTGEPSAPLEARPLEQQSFTFSFAVEHRPGEVHTIPKPELYKRFRDAGLYSFVLDAGTAKEKRFEMFGGELPFWSYRRILSAELLGLPGDVALINWEGNDYFGRPLVGVPPHERALALQEAKAQALGFLYWLQTEAPRDDGGTGYPELKLRPDVMGTADGLSKAPYIRESRRLVARTRVREQDIAASGQVGARAAPFADSVGIGWYPIDLHRCVGNREAGCFTPTLPFQIPLGSLLPETPHNLVVACKNVGTTHLTNGAYRLHPVEWAVGEAAGTLAAFCCSTGRTPAEVASSPALVRDLQTRLLRAGAPLAWTTDVSFEHPLFVPVQQLVLAGAVVPGSERFGRLNLELDEPLSENEVNSFVRAASSLLGRADKAFVPHCEALRLARPTWRELALQLVKHQDLRTR